jgi:hypothetical protein
MQLPSTPAAAQPVTVISSAAVLSVIMAIMPAERMRRYVMARSSLSE